MLISINPPLVSKVGLLFLSFSYKYYITVCNLLNLLLNYNNVMELLLSLGCLKGSYLLS